MDHFLAWHIRLAFGSGLVRLPDKSRAGVVHCFKGSMALASAMLCRRTDPHSLKRGPLLFSDVVKCPRERTASFIVRCRCTTLRASSVVLSAPVRTTLANGHSHGDAYAARLVDSHIPLGYALSRIDPMADLIERRTDSL